MSYTKPPLDSIPFSFTNTGYSGINLSNIDYDFVITTMSSILTAFIEGSAPFTNGGYTYTKSCKKVAIGFVDGQTQILSLPCLYGGVQDLYGFARVCNRETATLSSFAYGTYSDYNDLLGYIAGFIDVGIYSDLIGTITGTLPISLDSSIAGILPSLLNASVGVAPTVNIDGTVHGYQASSVEAFLSIDLPSQLLATIGTAQPQYLTANIFTEAPLDLEGAIGGHLPHNIYSSLHGWSVSDITSVVATHISEYLYSTISVVPPQDLYGYIGGRLAPDLYGYMGGHPSEELSSFIIGWQYSTLNSFIGTDIYKELPSFARGFFRESTFVYGGIGSVAPKDLYGYVSVESGVDIIAMVRGWQESVIQGFVESATPYALVGIVSGISLPPPLTANINIETPSILISNLMSWALHDLAAITTTNFPYYLTAGIITDLPHDIYGYVNTLQRTPYFLSGFMRGVPPSDISAFLQGINPAHITGTIHGWQVLDLSTLMLGDVPVDLPSYLHVFQRSSGDVTSNLHGWQGLNLPATLRTCFMHAIETTINVDVPFSLYSTLRIWFSYDLSLSMMSWATFNMYGSIHPFVDSSIYAYLLPIPSVDLYGFIFPKHVGESDLYGAIRALKFYNLPALAISYADSTLISTLRPVEPFLLGGTLSCFTEWFLYGSVNGQEYPYNLPASINASGGTFSLSAYLQSLKSSGAFYNIGAVLGGFQSSSFSAFLEPIEGYSLSAFIETSSYSNSLTATLIPKIVRLSKIVSVITMESFALSAMVNTSCFGSNFYNLGGTIDIMYLHNLRALLTGVVTYKGQYGLSATIGLDNKIIFTDKLPISVTTSYGTIRVMDVLPITIRAYAESANLFSGIVGVLTSTDLMATLVPTLLEDYDFTRVVNKELIYDLQETMGRAELSKIVEITFRNYVRDYVYLQEAGISFNKVIGDKWEVSLSSYLPENTTLRLKRRIYRATTLFALSAYQDLDSAVRDAIVYITELPHRDLMACINLNFNTSSDRLQAILTVLRPTSTNHSITASVVGESPQVITTLGSDCILSIV